MTRKSRIFTEQPSRNQNSLLGVSWRPWRLGGEEWFRIHRQDAKNAKNLAKQNFFQESKDLQLSSTDRSVLFRDFRVIPCPLKLTKHLRGPSTLCGTVLGRTS